MRICNGMLFFALLFSPVGYSAVLMQDSSVVEVKREDGRNYLNPRIIVGSPPVVGSPAEAAGIIQNDTILEIDGENILCGEDVVRIINASKGNPLNFTIARDGDTLTKVVTPVYAFELKRYMVGIRVGHVIMKIFEELGIDEELITYRFFDNALGGMNTYRVSDKEIYEVFKFFSVSLDSMVDKRDGEVYRILNIDGKSWMLDNLRYKVDNSWCDENKKSLCKMGGRHYGMRESTRKAMGIKKVNRPKKSGLEAMIEDYRNPSFVDQDMYKARKKNKIKKVLEKEFNDVCPNGYVIPTLDEYEKMWDNVVKMMLTFACESICKGIMDKCDKCCNGCGEFNDKKIEALRNVRLMLHLDYDKEIFLLTRTVLNGSESIDFDDFDNPQDAPKKEDFPYYTLLFGLTSYDYEGLFQKKRFAFPEEYDRFNDEYSTYIRCVKQ